MSRDDGWWMVAFALAVMLALSFYLYDKANADAQRWRAFRHAIVTDDARMLEAIDVAQEYDVDASYRGEQLDAAMDKYAELVEDGK